MAQKTIVMSLIKQVQQLRQEGVAIKEIVRRVGLSRKTVKKYLRRLEKIPPTADKGGKMPVKELAAIVYNKDKTTAIANAEKRCWNILHMQKRNAIKQGSISRYYGWNV